MMVENYIYMEEKNRTQLEPNKKVMAFANSTSPALVPLLSNTRVSKQTLNNEYHLCT